MPRKNSSKKSSSQPLIAERYRRVQILGKGGGGAVYLVQDTLAGNKNLALKVVEKVKGLTPALADLKNEFATLSLLQHPNLAGVYDFGATEREMFFTGEWVDGEDILSATRHADLNTVFQVVVQVLRALDYLHQRGVLHLDLKPANILVTDPDRTGELTVKLIDFGIAQWKKQGRVQSADFSGSPPYAPPELLLEQEPGPASDIYSLGMLLHQVFAGRFPFASQDPLEIMMRQTYEDPKRIERLDPALPPAFADLLHRMVTRNPAARFSSAREVLEQINLCLGETFNLRSSRAPARILEESDLAFHPELLEDLSRRIFRGERVELSGPAGAGKTRLLERFKAQLQQRGVSPLHFREVAAWREYLSQLPSPQDRPVLLDWNEAPDEALLAPFSGAVLWTRRDPVTGGPPHETVLLPSLDEAKLDAFLRAEIRGAPEGTAAFLLEANEVVFPGGLEAILQALREEGRLTWSSGGWNWRGEAPRDPAALLERQAERDREKRRRVREFLEGSRLSLPGRVLEGMLGYEAGAFRDVLQAWMGEGWLHGELRNGVKYYSVSASGAQPGTGTGDDPEAAARQLNQLYDQGKFAAGIAWIEAWIKSIEPQPLPPKIALVGARHLVAERQAERALSLLENLEFSESSLEGLLFETRARSENLLARFDEAKASLDAAESRYRGVEELRGLARVQNLRGLICRAERQWSAAERHLGEAIALAARGGDLYTAGIAQTNLALVWQDQGKVEEAYAGYQQAWELARKEPHPFLLQSLYQKWINLLHHGGKSAEAEAACYEWLSLTIQHHYRDQQAVALNYLSLIEGRKGHLERKAAYLDQALELLDPTKQPHFHAQLLVNRAYLNWSQGKFLPAQLDAEAALHVERLWPEHRILAWIHLILGKVYRDRPQPDWEKSADCFDRAAANIQKNQTFESLWEVEYNRGLLAKVRGDRSRAEQYLQQAKRAVEEFAARLPESLRTSYLRDRKLETVRQELESLATQPSPSADN